MNTQNSIFLKIAFGVFVPCFVLNENIYSSFANASDFPSGSLSDSSPLAMTIPTKILSSIPVHDLNDRSVAGLSKKNVSNLRARSAPESRITPEEGKVFKESVQNILDIISKCDKKTIELFGENLIQIGNNLKGARNNSSMIRPQIEEETTFEFLSVFSDSESIRSVETPTFASSSLFSLEPTLEAWIQQEEIEEPKNASDSESFQSTSVALPIAKKEADIPLFSSDPEDSMSNAIEISADPSSFEEEVDCLQSKALSDQIVDQIVEEVNILTTKMVKNAIQRKTEQQFQKDRSVIMGIVPSRALCRSKDGFLKQGEFEQEYEPENMSQEDMQKINQAVENFCTSSVSDSQRAQGVYKGKQEDCFFITLNSTLVKKDLDSLAKVLRQDSYIWIENGEFTLRFPRTDSEYQTQRYNWLESEASKSDYTLLTNGTVKTYLSIDFSTVECS